ncbi:AraC family transcriptional regulator [Glycocaulis profundi]|nr:AraC family transcriptional regulator [Glycocaulis profundi]
MRNQRDLAALIARLAPEDGMIGTPVPRVGLVRSSAATEPLHTLYTPSLCLVAEGRKQVTMGGRVFTYDPASFLVVGIDLPTVGAVVSASPDAPYLCMRLEFDRAVIADVIAGTDGPASGQAAAGVSQASPGLIDAAARLLALAGEPEMVPALAPLIEREIIHRVLAGPQGGMLRQIASGQGRLGRVDRAVRHIRAHYREAVTIDELAGLAGMSPSAFHEHFREVTGMSPLQFRTRIRLHEARRLMLMDGAGAAEAGFAVGYESPSHFNRDYARVHGAPPRRDIDALRGQRIELA